MPNNIINSSFEYLDQLYLDNIAPYFVESSAGHNLLSTNNVTRKVLDYYLFNMNIGLFVCSSENILFINNYLLNILGYSQPSIKNIKPLNLVHKNDRKKLLKCLKKKDNFNLTLIVKGANNSSYTFFVQLNIRDKVIVGDCFLIQKKAKDENLHYSLLHSLLQNSYDVIGVFNEDGTIKYKSPSFGKIFGYNIESIIGMHCMELIHPDDYEYVRNIIEYVRAKEGRSLTNFAKIKRIDGDYLECQVTISNHLSNQLINGFVVNYKNVTFEKEYQRIIKKLSYYDPLTGLPNKKFLFKKLSMHIKNNNHSFAIVTIYVPQNKGMDRNVNPSSYEQLVLDVVTRTKKRLNALDIIAHTGEDKFSIVLFKYNNIEKWVKHLVEFLKEPYYISNEKSYINVYAGVSIYKEHGDSIFAVYNNATKALEYAIQRDTAFKIYTQQTNCIISKRFAIEGDLRKAVKNNELFLLYQPKVNLLSGEIVSIEALIRWENKEGDLISPHIFIPIAEKSELIIDIGDWILRQICYQIKKWEGLGIKPMRVAINLSAKQFEYKNLAIKIKQILKKYKIDPSWIELEITETTVMENLDEMIQQLKQLKNLGIKISLDDFGTGYSSLYYLKKLPIDTLKIDKSFIENVKNDKDNQEIVKAIISLGKNLKKEIVAEGVETLEQSLFLKETGCVYGQGFFFYTPLNHQQIAEILMFTKE